ncbi:MAG: DNA gyrase subunit A [Lentisphaerae bacterium RIFOXYB12_FULL_60_10]|nr:MAG: DNA gyrase subunit A [Lentisphaerae bacterium RIFOXYB12_FULL_60_10]
MDETQDLTSDQHIATVHIEEEMRGSYIDYSMSVIVGRALPDARDGLKPVHRRVLFAMQELGNAHNRPYKKSARVVGDVIGKYHPHGDQAVYDTIVRMAQDFSLRYLLVDGQGNFGSIDGDPPAAMRYTEVRMSRLAEELLADLDKETVNFGPNYDESLQQPLVLPSKFPNLLVNGSTGIAVGMATNIPPHNLREIIDAIVAQIDNPAITVQDLLHFVKGPDFPTGGIICGTAPIHAMYKTGRGQMKVRGRACIEEGKQGKETIIITEIPYTVNKTTLIESIAGLIQDKTLEGISDLRDESNKEGIRIVMELKRGTVPKVLLNNLYKHTQLQTTFGAILLAIDDGKPRVMNLKDLIHCFTTHRFEVITRRTRFELQKAEARAHILEGLKIALDNLDAVVRTIREARNRDMARASLMNRFKLTEVQANAILDMRLYQLTGLEREKIDAEYLELIKTISYLRDLLANEHKIYGVIKQELLEIREKYGDARQTDIAPDEGEVNIEDLVADRGCVITISHTGYIKRVPPDTYRAQRRGGKGVSGMATKEEDFVEHVFSANTHDTILFFTGGGRVYAEKVYEIPEASRTSRGKAIVNLLNIRNDEKIAAMIRVREFAETEFLVMATARGVVKRTSLGEYSNIRRDGIIAINIDPEDELIAVEMIPGNSEIILTTRKGMSIRFPDSGLRDQGRATRGVRGITLGEGDRVESMELVNPESTLLICTENGYGKRSPFDEYRVQGRGGRGVIAIRTSDRNGCVVAAHAVKESDAMMLITAHGKMIRINVNDVRVIGRATQGVRLISLDEGDTLVSAATVEPEADQDETTPTGTAPTPVTT